jgi:hypothetical protein
MFLYQTQTTGEQRRSPKNSESNRLALQKSIDIWAKDSRINKSLLPQLYDNMAWLASKSEESPDKKQIYNLLDSFFHGAGRGEAGMRTLDSIISDLRAQGVRELSSEELRNFMCYYGGKKAGGLRKSIATPPENSFNISTALLVGGTGRSKTRPSKSESVESAYGNTQPVDQIMGKITEGQHELGKRLFEVTGNAKNIALGEGVWGLLKVAFTAGLQHPITPEQHMASFMLRKAGVRLGTEGSVQYQLVGTYLDLQKSFGQLNLAYDDLRTSIKYGQLDKLPQALEDFAAKYEAYLLVLQELRLGLENYNFEGGRAYVEGALFAVDAIGAALIPAGIGGMWQSIRLGSKELAEEGIRAATRKTIRSALKPAAWWAFAKGPTGQAMASALVLQAYTVSEGKRVSEAMEKFNKDNSDGLATLAGMTDGLLEEIKDERESIASSRRTADKAAAKYLDGLQSRLETLSENISTLAEFLSEPHSVGSDERSAQVSTDFGRLLLDFTLIALAIKVGARTR